MEITMTRLMYLLYLQRMREQECTVTKIARLFEVSKSTVSRNVEYLVEQGVVYSDGMRLTAHGEQLAAAYSEEVSLFQCWLSAKVDCGEKQNRENAMQMAVNLTEEVKKKLLQKIRLTQMFGRLSHRGEIAFSEFAGELPDGAYPVSVVVYREKIQEGKYLSMANKGFAHPAQLRIMGGSGMIELRAVTMERRNMRDNLVTAGKLLKLDYCRKGEYEAAAKDGDLYQIPADALEYTFHREENLLIGNLMIQLYAPLANKKLHTKKAMLSVIIQAV